MAVLFSRLDTLEEDINKRCGAMRRDSTGVDFTINDVAKAVPQGALLCEFVRYADSEYPPTSYLAEYCNLMQVNLPERYLCLTLDHAGVVRLHDAGDAVEIDSLITAARQMLYDVDTRVFSPLAPQLEQRLNEITGQLYRRLIDPIAADLNGITDLYISPDGLLNLLPFEILPHPDGGYLLEKYGISYLSSGRDLPAFSTPRENGGVAVLLADPDFDALPLDPAHDNPVVIPAATPDPSGTSWNFRTSACADRFTPLQYGREEAVAVAAAITGRGNITLRQYYGREAGEGVLKTLAAPPRMLHLTTHGFFCDDSMVADGEVFDNPLLRSGLALAGANRMRDGASRAGASIEDGILTAFEAADLNLVGTELAVLSACETGVGEATQWEGVFGLQRAFRHAGVQSVLMSLWKVPDRETAELIAGFYTKWLQGRSKRDALRESALDLLARTRRAKGHGHPLFWAGFVLTGNPK